MSDASIVEGIWSAIAGFGLLLSIIEAVTAHTNLVFLLEHNFNGRRRIVGGGHLRRQVLSAIVQLLFLIVGVAAMGTPSATPGVNPLAVMLLTASALIVLNSWLDRHDRKRLIAYWSTVELSHAEERDEEIKRS